MTHILPLYQPQTSTMESSYQINSSNVLQLLPFWSSNSIHHKVRCKQLLNLEISKIMDTRQVKNLHPSLNRLYRHGKTLHSNIFKWLHKNSEFPKEVAYVKFSKKLFMSDKAYYCHITQPCLARTKSVRPWSHQANESIFNQEQEEEEEEGCTIWFFPPMV